MRIIPYLRVSELDGAMRSFLPLGEDVRFVVPSRRDRNWWRKRAGEFGLDGPPEDILWLKKREQKLKKMIRFILQNL